MAAGWLDWLKPPEQGDPSDRARRYPEQYPATTDAWAELLPEDTDPLVRRVRPLLANTQLESRPLEEAYRASRHGWSARAFHSRVDGKGAAVVVASGKGGALFGGYNPKGWASMGGARPSIAAFLFDLSDGRVKLPKTGGPGLAISADDPSEGIAFGVDALAIPLVGSGVDARVARSRLGAHFALLPDGRRSLLPGGAPFCSLSDLVVLVGRYADGEVVPYAGAVMDFTSG